MQITADVLNDYEIQESNIHHFNAYKKLINQSLTSTDKNSLINIDNTFFLYLIHRWLGINESNFRNGSLSDLNRFYDSFTLARFQKQHTSGTVSYFFIPFGARDNRVIIGYPSLYDKARPRQWGCEYGNRIRLSCEKTDCRFRFRPRGHNCRIDKPNIWVKDGSTFIFANNHLNHIKNLILKKKKVNIDSLLRLFYKESSGESFARFKNDFHFDNSELPTLFEGELIESLEEITDELGSFIEVDTEIKEEIIDIKELGEVEQSDEEKEMIKVEGLLKEVEEDLCGNLNFKMEFLRVFIDKKALVGMGDELLHKISSALNSGKHLILSGPPGTGKSCIAEAICNAAKQYSIIDEYKITTATSDWTTYETIGGYFPNPKNTGIFSLEFRPGVFLSEFSRKYINSEERKITWHIIDEINRAQIDKAFGPFFTLLAGQKVKLPFIAKNQRQIEIIPANKDNLLDVVQKLINNKDPSTFIDPKVNSIDSNLYLIPEKWRLIGTMNCYDKDYLYKMSNAFLRRFSIIHIDIPNKESYSKIITDVLTQTELKNLLTLEESVFLQKRLLELLFREEDLSSLQKVRKIGPSIIIDIIKYISANEKLIKAKKTSETITTEKLKKILLNLIVDGIIIFLLPQLSDIDQEHVKNIYNSLFINFDQNGEIQNYLIDNHMLLIEDDIY